MLDQMSMPATVPVFGEGGDLNKSPYVGMPEDFMAYLFNSPSQAMTPVMGPNYTKSVALHDSRVTVLTPIQLCGAARQPVQRIPSGH